MELLKTIIKTIVMVVITFFIIKFAYQNFLMTLNCDSICVLIPISHYAVKITTYLAAGLFLIALADILLQRWAFHARYANVCR